MIELDDDRLAEILADIGQLLVTASVADGAVDPAPWWVDAPADSPVDVPGERRRPLQLAALAALAAAAAVVTVVVAVAPLRGAVADWLGLGSTSVRIDPSPTSTSVVVPSIDAGLPMIDRAEAEQRLGVPLPVLDDTALGVPSGYARMPEGGVLVVWPDASTLWIHVESIDPDVYFQKIVASSSVVRRLDDLGDSAMVIVGGHFLQTPHRTVTAATAVLWRSGDLEYRLESERDAADLIALARELAGG